AAHFGLVWQIKIRIGDDDAGYPSIRTVAGVRDWPLARTLTEEFIAAPTVVTHMQGAARCTRPLVRPEQLLTSGFRKTWHARSLSARRRRRLAPDRAPLARRAVDPACDRCRAPGSVDEEFALRPRAD